MKMNFLSLEKRWEYQGTFTNNFIGRYFYVQLVSSISKLLKTIFHFPGNNSFSVHYTFLHSHTFFTTKDMCT